VTDATINSMAAKNEVLSAENKVEFEKISTEHD
jgi:hypothetical protein